jgi:hypothetical protein
MTMEDRGVHPDLVEEEAAAAEVAADAARETAPPRRSRAGRAQRQGGEPAAPTDNGVQPATDDAAGESSPDSGETPDWLKQAREATDPAEAFKLLAKNLPREVLERDETLSGLVGHKADAMLRARQQQEIERQKREAAQNNDLYTLGELTQRELQEREAQTQAAVQQGNGTFMDGVVLFQQQLPEDIQRQVAGQTFGSGKGQAQGVAEYLQFISDARVKLREQELEHEFQRRESALRKSVLSEVNGDEPVPERESGTPGRVREVTDEQIEAMTMQEYNALFDEAGRPKPGVRHRATRGIPLTQR